AATDPNNDCAATSVETCGQNGLCDGAGRCAAYSEGTACSDPQCARGELTRASTCQSGVCTAELITSECPSGRAADRLGCAASCVDDASCSLDTHCAADGGCSPLLSRGSPCGRHG